MERGWRGLMHVVGMLMMCSWLGACLPVGSDGGNGGGGVECEAGEHRCECTDAGTCDDGLLCSAGGTCVDVLCSDGQLDCPCRDDGSCDDGLTCGGLVCVSDDTQNNTACGGALGCVCEGSDECDGGLECTDGRCVESGENNITCSPGELDCPCDIGSRCDDDLICEDGVCIDGSVGNYALDRIERVVIELASSADEGFGEANFANAGDEPLTVRNITLRSEVGSFGILETPELPFVLDPGESFDVSVRSASGFGSEENALIVALDEIEPVVVSLFRAVEVDLDNTCPTALIMANSVSLPVNSMFELDGRGSSDADGSIRRFEWTVVSKPSGSSARLSPNADSDKVRLWVDRVGTYVVELVVYDDLDLASCAPHRVTLEAVDDSVPDEIVIELTWDTPADMDQSDTMGTDIDVHYMHPLGIWDQAPYDIYWQNRTADWGVPGSSADDPNLEVDDTDGMGPERIRHEGLEPSATYRVGVYYYNDNGFGASFVTVRVSVAGQLTFEQVDKQLAGENTFWDVATIAGADQSVTLVDTTQQGFP